MPVSSSGLRSGGKSRPWRPSAAHSDAHRSVLSVSGGLQPKPFSRALQPCFLPLVSPLLLTQPSVLLSPSPPPPILCQTPAFLCPPADALLSAELERISAVRPGPCGLKWLSCHPLVHRKKSSHSIKVLSSVRPSLVPNAQVSFPWRPSHITSAVAPGAPVTHGLSAVFHW